MTLFIFKNNWTATSKTIEYMILKESKYHHVYIPMEYGCCYVKEFAIYPTEILLHNFYNWDGFLFNLNAYFNNYSLLETLCFSSLLPYEV